MLYYEINLRIEEGYDDLETIYVGNGMVCIKDGYIEGCIARDYISGSISENKLYLSTLDVDFKDRHELTTKGARDITLPGRYTLYGYNGGVYDIAEITFAEKLPEEKIVDTAKEIKEIKELALNLHLKVSK